MKSNTIGIVARRGNFHTVSRALRALALSVLALPCLLSAQTTLQHRYSFVSDASDSVGGANGTQVGPNGGTSCTINNGLVLPGGGGGGFSGYVTLPSGLLTTTTNLTIECWVTQNQANGWATVWDFANDGSHNFELCPNPQRGINNLDVAITPNGGEVDTVTGFLFPSGSEQYVTFTFNSTNLTGQIYENGVLDATQVYPNSTYVPGTIGGSGGTTVNALGNDIFGDTQFQGTLYELRIYNGILTPNQIAINNLVGPTNLVSSYTPSSVTFVAGSTNLVITGTAQSSMEATFATTTGSDTVNAVGEATNWVSSNPSVLQVSSSGLITGVAIGNATVRATVNGVTATSPTIFVTAPQTLLHRYSFVADASDSVGGAAWNGTLVSPNGGTNATISNGLLLPGGGGPGYSGYVTLPAGILTNTTSVTVECWATQNNGNTWAELYSFNNGTPSYLSMIPMPANNNGDMVMALRYNNNESDASSSVPFPTNSEQYITETFNASTLVGNLYDNGQLIASVTAPNSSYVPGSMDLNNVFLGQDPWPDPQFQGTIHEFRIWNGAVSPVYTAVAAAAGPGVIVSNLTPSSVTVTPATTSMIGSQTQQVTVVGNFVNANNVTVTGGATNWVSSNPAVLTVNQSGLVTAASGGTATVSATVGGVTGTSTTITVATTPPDITQYPSNATVVVGDSASFSVASIGGGGLHYQWNFNSTPIPGATNTTLTLTDIQLSQAGTYSVLVANSAGNSTVSAVLTVDQAILLHRYSFVSDASDSVGGSKWNGTVVVPNGGTAAMIDNGLTLAGGGGPGYSGYVTLPPGILTNTASLTVECWATQSAQNQWAELWNFNNGQSQYIGVIPYPANNNGNMSMAIKNGTEDDAFSSVLFPTGSRQYIASTFSAATLTGDLFDNGSNIASVTVPGNYVPGTFNTANNYLGQDPYGDLQFQGTIYEFRIWDGAQSPLYLAVSAIAGPSVVVTNLTPTSIDVTVTNDTMVEGQSQPASAVGNFVNASGIAVTGYVTNWTSSDTAVVTVSSSGVVTAVGTGSATISATLNGATGTSSTISVPASQPIITQQPEASDTFLQGATLTASVSNIGTPPFVYKWFYNNGATPISTSSSPLLTIPDVQSGNAGTYTVEISNSSGSVTSSDLVVSIMPTNAYEQAVLEDGAVAYWPLQETSGTIAYDVIGGDNGIYTNFPAIEFSSFTLAQPGPSQSYFGGSSYGVLFQQAIADIPQGQLNITGPLTVTAWVQESVAAQFASIVGHGDNSWRITLTENGDPNGGLPGGNDGGSVGDATAPISDSINDGNWHMVAYTYSGNPSQADNGLLFLDGALVASNSITAAPTGDNYDVWIGGSPDYGTNRIMQYAAIAHVAVFSQAFTPAQVQGLYNGTYVAPPLTVRFTGNPVISGTSLKFSLTSSTAATVYLLSSTNLLTPISQWTPVWTNVLSGAGTLTTNLAGAVHSGYKQQFYILSTKN